MDLADKDRSILYRRMEHLYRNMRSGQFITLANASFLAFINQMELGHWVVGAWWLVAVAVSLFRLQQFRAYARLSPGEIEALLWLRRFRTGAALTGVIWGCGAWYFITNGSEGLQFFNAFIMTGMVAGAVPVLGADRVAFQAYAVPVALAVMLSIFGLSALHLAATGMVFVFLLAVVNSAGKLSQTLDEAYVLESKLKSLNDSLEDQVRERTAELEKANAELKVLDQMKSDFISTVSHELRTPMTSIVGFAKLARKKLAAVILPEAGGNDKAARAAEQIRGNLNIIVSESERLTLLINDVLDSAKLDAGKVEWQFLSLAPERLLERAAAVTHALTQNKGLPLSWEALAPLPEISGDENRLLQVLINLISNAAKFTEQGSIFLAAERQDGMIRFSVRDTGIGIAPEFQGKVFDKFKQIGDTLTAKPAGTGLGLSICRQIIEHHGGCIWLESEPGQGSTFHFTVPVAMAPGP